MCAQWGATERSCDATNNNKNASREARGLQEAKRIYRVHKHEFSTSAQCLTSEDWLLRLCRVLCIVTATACASGSDHISACDCIALDRIGLECDATRWNRWDMRWDEMIANQIYASRASAESGSVGHRRRHAAATSARCRHSITIALIKYSTVMYCTAHMYSKVNE